MRGCPLSMTDGDGVGRILMRRRAAAPVAKAIGGTSSALRLLSPLKVLTNLGIFRANCAARSNDFRWSAKVCFPAGSGSPRGHR